LRLIFALWYLDPVDRIEAGSVFRICEYFLRIRIRGFIILNGSDPGGPLIIDCGHIRVFCQWV
jgi:hypothetical protein